MGSPGVSCIGRWVLSHRATREAMYRLFDPTRMIYHMILAFLFLFFPIFIGVQMIYGVVLVSAVQQSESVAHIHIPTLF